MKNLLLIASIVFGSVLVSCSTDEIQEPASPKTLTTSEILQNSGMLRAADTINEADNGDVTNPKPRN